MQLIIGYSKNEHCIPYKIEHAIGDVVYFKTDTDIELYIIVGICLYQDHPRYLLSNSEKHEIMATDNQTTSFT